MKIFFCENTLHNSVILHTNSSWICVIKVCSNGGATYTWVCSSAYNKNVKLYNITIIVH